MNAVFSKITAKSQTTVPREVREALKVKPGDTLVYRIAKGKFRINGVDLAPAAKTIDWGRRIVNYRTNITVDAIRKAMKK